jgi:hypothetical protein
MTIVVEMTWQRRRSRFNHDWLKNQYLLSFGKCVNVLAGKVQDPEFDRERFLRRVVREWEQRGGEGLALGQDYESAMSPAVFFETTALRNCSPDTLVWLRPLIHELWKVRCDAGQHAQAVIDAANDTHAAFEMLKAAVEGDRTESDETLADRFNGFADCCQRLSQAISRLESTVRVI